MTAIVGSSGSPEGLSTLSHDWKAKAQANRAAQKIKLFFIIVFVLV
jgi:hypothetical protein